MTPEQKAREQIDAMLVASGWVVQTKDKINLAAQRGVAICELSFKTGEPDYTLFVDGKAIGTVEAKPAGVIAVTVDMIATGTDIKPLEVLIFLRDVRSRVYFEQMKGRGTRVVTPTDLQSVSGEDAREFIRSLTFGMKPDNN